MALVNSLRAGLLPAIFLLASGACRADWVPLAEIKVEAHTERVFAVHQTGMDLAVRVRRDSEEISVQDGPDDRFGAEVLVLRNHADAAVVDVIEIRPTKSDQIAVARLTELSGLDEAEKSVATLLQNASISWLQSEDADVALAMVDQLPAITPGRSPAVDLLINQWFQFRVEALRGSGHAQLALAMLADNKMAADPAEPYSLFHLRYLEASVLWDVIDVEKALDKAQSLLVDYESWLSGLAAPSEITLLRHDAIRALVGGLRIFVGRKIGCEALMHSGGDVIDQAMLSASQFNDDELTGTLLMYQSGYRSMVDGRVNGFSPVALQTAEQLLRKSGSNDLLADLLNNRAYGELGKGNLGLAQSLYREAINLSESSRNQEGKAHFQSRLAYSYYIAGDFHRAEVLLRESLEAFERLGLSRKLTHEKLQLAAILREAGRQTDALDVLLLLDRQIDDSTWIEDELRIRTQLANVYTDLGYPDQAESVLMREEPVVMETVRRDDVFIYPSCGQLPAKSSPQFDIASRLHFQLEREIALARVDLRKQRYSQVLSRVDTAIAKLNEGQTEPLQKLSLLQLKMLVYRDLKNTEALMTTGALALALIESVRDDFQAMGVRPHWTYRTNEVIDLIIAENFRRYAQTGNAEIVAQNFELLQARRARTLRERRRAGELPADEPMASRQLTNWEDMIAKKRRLLEATLSGQAAVEYERAYLKAEQRWLSDQPIAPSTSRLATIDLHKVQHLLALDTEILVYQLGFPASHVIQISRNSINVIPLLSRESLTGLAADTLSEIESSKGGSKLLGQLSAALLGPVRFESTTRKVIIETEGLLGLVPFSALTNADDVPLISEFSLVSVPSISLYFDRVEPAAVLGQQVAEPVVQKPLIHKPAIVTRETEISLPRLKISVIADPVFGEAETVAVAALPSEYRGWRNGLAPLPYTRVEADNTISIFGKAQTASYLGAEASISALLRQDVRQSRILHIASHGFASLENPLFQGLALAGEDDMSGLLTTDEILATHFENELVVISGCETARGEVLGSEGMMSLSRSFLAQGAKATIATLWPVSDRANAEFMKYFYVALVEDGRDLAGSLQFAQMQLRRNPRYRAPFYWGAFLLEVADASFEPVLH